MKKMLRYLPYLLYVFGFLSFILPAVYLKLGEITISYNTLQLIFGDNGQDFSIGLFIVFLLFLITIGISIALEYKTSKIGQNICYILGLATGVLLFFSRILSNPSVTDFNIHIGLILPGVFVISGTITLFINKRILGENDGK